MSSHDGGKGVELDSLIMNLKHKLQTFSDPEKEKAPSVVAAYTSSAAVANAPPLVVENNNKNKYMSYFIHKGLFSAELFVFFFLLLLVVRPSFLYYNERVMRNRREMIRTKFSVLYLFLWSMFLTLVVHLMAYVQRKMAVAFPLL
jgi:hypothetical protein